jgi:hypothetical protein
MAVSSGLEGDVADLLNRGVCRFLAVAVLYAVAVANSDSRAAPLTTGNFLVTNHRTLYEFTRDGVEVQSWAIPHPTNPTSYDPTDPIVDRYGNVHVINMYPFQGDYFSTLNPSTGEWQHTWGDFGGLGHVADGDGGILGDIIYFRNRTFDVVTRATDWGPSNVDTWNGLGEVTVGLDGLLYILGNGFPRDVIRVVDPHTNEIIREMKGLIRDPVTRQRMDAHGIAVSASGDIYIADNYNRIDHYTPDGRILNSIVPGVVTPTDIDLRPDGTLIVGSRFGAYAIGDTSLTSFKLFNGLYGELSYVGFTDAIIPEPAVMILFAGAVFIASKRPRRATLALM